jgi:LysR family transcriptional regulator, regulator for bpeEF and oprC
MDRTEAMRLFTRIVELRSFTAAAEAQGLPRATATHAIQQMEQRLGVRLLQRTTRSVTPTLDGQAYYERCVRVLADLEEMDAFIGEAAAQPQGKLRVDLQPTLAMALLVPRLGEFCARYPGLELEIGMGDRLVDLVREGVDCVVRGGEPRDSSLVARRVALREQVTCASPAYLAQHGTPRTLEQFRQHRAVNYVSSATGKRMPFEFVVDGKLQAIHLKSTVSVNNVDAYVACARQGLGLVQMPRYHVQGMLDAGELVEVLKKVAQPPMPVSVLYPHHRQLSPRVRVFIDWVVDCLAQEAPAPAARKPASPSSRGTPRRSPARSRSR